MRRGCKVQERAGFTLVEIMVVVAVIALLATLALPGLARARKRSQAATVKNELRLIDDAVAQYAIERYKKTGDPVYVDDWTEYMKVESRLSESGVDVLGHDYADQTIDRLPLVPGATFDALSDAVDAAFWLPYSRETVPGKVTKKKKKK